MTSTRLRWVSRLARGIAGVVAVSRLAKVARTSPSLAPAATTTPSVNVVIPARNEASRLGPLLDSIIRAPGVGEVIVVDDRSSDDTAAMAADAGATVVVGRPLPDGWAGKAWALQQGLDACSSDWVVTLDADARPDPRLPMAMAARAEADGFDFATAGGRFECPTRPTRWLHAAMLTTLVYRFGPPGVDASPGRVMANGQCMAVRRHPFLAAGGMSLVRAEVVEDVALARRLARDGWSVGFIDGAELLTVRMFESLPATWTGWGRSLALPGVETRQRQLVDLAVVLLAQAMPLPRLLTGRGDLIDVALVAARVGTLAGTRRAYDRADLAYWLSPLADIPAAGAIARGIVAGRRQTWRGRTYG